MKKSSLLVNTIALLILPLTISPGFALPMQSDHGVIKAVPCKKKIKVDGKLDPSEWDLTGMMYVYPVKKIRERYAAKVYANYDKNSLYIAIEFRDPTPMINNVDAIREPYGGWKADGFQARFITDYPQIHFTSWYSSMSKYSVATISYNRPLNEKNTAKFSKPGAEIHDSTGFEQVFRTLPDNRGYVQELRIPWKLLYKKVPDIKGGLKFGFTGEYFWGGSTGNKWPKVMWSDPLNQKNPVRIVVYQNPGVWGKMELLDKGDLPVKEPTDGEELKLQGPVPIKFALPDDAIRFSLAIDDNKGRRVRNLANHQLVKDYLVRTEGGKHYMEVLWDGRPEGDWEPDLLLFMGPDVVKPGKYTARVLWHKGVGVLHEGSFYNPGRPSWPVSDGSGAWLSDHMPPAYIAALKKSAPLEKGKPKGRLLVASHGAESGVPMIGINDKGAKIWEFNRGSCSIGDVAANSRNGFVAYTYNGKPFLGKININNGSLISFKGSGADIVLPGESRGIDANDRSIAAAIGNRNEIVIYDVESGARQKEIRIANPHRLSFTPDGKNLVALTKAQNNKNHKAHILSLSGKALPIRFGKVQDPSDVAFDSGGRMYVSDIGPDQNVKVFEKVSAAPRLIGTIGDAGGHTVGPWTPQRMSNPNSLTVEEYPDGKLRVWVTESHQSPRRISVWDGKGKLVKDYIGNTGYMGSGGILSDSIPDLGIYLGVIFKLDYENYSYKPVEVMGGRPPAREGMHYPFGLKFGGLGFENGFHFISKASRKEVQYYVEGWDARKVYMKRKLKGGDTRWICVSALGCPRHYRFPKDFPQPPGPNSVFAWNDTNSDGYAQKNEISWRSFPGRKVFHHAMWAYRCSAGLEWFHSGVAFKPTSWTDDGAPVYDISKAEVLPGDLGKVTAGDIYKTKYGYTGTFRSKIKTRHNVIHGMHEIRGYNTAGELKWTYPAFWNSVHGGFTAPMAMPGLVMGVLKITGIVDNGKHSIISLHGNHGQEFLIRDDGMYIGELFTDQRMAPESLPDKVEIRGIPINDTTIGGEPFSGWIARQDDGVVRYSYGQTDVRIARVTGLDSLSTIEPVSVNLTSSLAAKAKAFKHVTGTKQATTYVVKKRGPFPKNEKAFEANALPIKAGRNDVGRFRMAYDKKNLYVVWQAFDESPMVNKGSSAPTAFRSGDSVNLYIAPDKKYNGQTGGTRVLLTSLSGKKTAVVIRREGAGSKPYTYKSPVRESPVPYAAVEPSIKFGINVVKDKQYYIVAAEIPWTALGLKPRKGMSFKADLGIIFGGPQTTRVLARPQWVDKEHTNVVDDEPTESEFYPDSWGTIMLE